MPWFYYATVLLLKGIFRFFTCLRVNGCENIPECGPVLIVSNHLSNADPPLLGVCLNREVKFMAKEELFRFRPFGYLITGFGAFPVRRGRLDRQALRKSYQVLNEKAMLVMYPEGTRSLDGKLRAALSGPALIAVRSGVPLLPIGISGTEKIRGITWGIRRPRITVNVGEVFYLPVVKGRVNKPELTEYTNMIMDNIANLLPSEYRGDYGNKEGK
ncbi:lysophospholipid acyltransferase family protein [Chloroflexota bacterium]